MSNSPSLTVRMTPLNASSMTALNSIGAWLPSCFCPASSPVTAADWISLANSGSCRLNPATVSWVMSPANLLVLGVRWAMILASCEPGLPVSPIWMPASPDVASRISRRAAVSASWSRSVYRLPSLTSSSTALRAGARVRRQPEVVELVLSSFRLAPTSSRSALGNRSKWTLTDANDLSAGS